MRIAALFAMCTLFSPLLPADVILLTTRQRVDGVISSYANGELAVRLANATSEVKIPISQVLSFTIVRSMTEPMQPAPLVGTDARRQEMQQRSQERRQTVRTNQMVNRYNQLMRQGNQLREQAYNLRIDGRRLGTTRVEQDRAEAQAQALLVQAEQFFEQARQLQRQLEEAGVQLDHTPPPAGSTASPSAGGTGLLGSDPLALPDDDLRRTR